MEYNKLIAEMSLSDEVEGFYVLKAAYPKTTATGKPFLSASLSDRSGSIEIKVWDYSGPISSADEGNVVKIQPEIASARESGRKSPSIARSARPPSSGNTGSALKSPSSRLIAAHAGSAFLMAIQSSTLAAGPASAQIVSCR